MRLLTTELLPARLRADFGLSWNRSDRAMAGAVARSVRTAVRFVPGSLRYWPHHGVAQRRMALDGNE
jgi:uncharacterized protein (DUF2236 family)